MQWLTPEKRLMVEHLEDFTQHRLHRATIVWALMNQKQSSLIQAVDELDRKHQTSFLLPDEDSSEEEGQENRGPTAKKLDPDGYFFEKISNDNYDKYRQCVIAWDGETFICHTRTVSYGNCPQCFEILPLGHCHSPCEPAMRMRAQLDGMRPHSRRIYFSHERMMYAPSRQELVVPQDGPIERIKNNLCQVNPHDLSEAVGSECHGRIDARDFMTTPGHYNPGENMFAVLNTEDILRRISETEHYGAMEHMPYIARVPRQTWDEAFNRANGEPFMRSPQMRGWNQWREHEYGGMRAQGWQFNTLPAYVDRDRPEVAALEDPEDDPPRYDENNRLIETSSEEASDDDQEANGQEDDL